LDLLKEEERLALLKEEEKGIWCYKKKEVKRREIEKEWLYYPGNPNLHKRRKKLVTDLFWC
jgi:hypothetical protein